ncbi:xaa-Pro aminopeptidase 1-like isoform X4 [Apostichopus japonicus]|uniref:xaa-Pro aminopeptidase 1-like isoform X4 n=1 Tax=Stichopus japonicus TaxID=307972 RepID=UPI003AB65700
MEKLATCLIAFAVLHLVTSSPIEAGHDVNIALPKQRVRRQDESVRDCTAVPPTYPETTVMTDQQLLNLRVYMDQNDIEAYIIPSEDAHQSEYIAEADERRRFVSGFDGSAGLAIVTTNRAAVWVDGRYFLQAKMQLDCNWVSQEIGEPNVPSPADWLLAESTDEGLGASLSNGAKVGFDPTLLSISTYFSYNETFEASDRGIMLQSIEENLVDSVWVDMEGEKPAYPGDELLILEHEYTGRTWEEKIFDTSAGYDTIRELMAEKDADALIVTKLDEIAWIFNLRGADIPYNPMFISYAIIETDAIKLYLYDMTTRAVQEIEDHLKQGSCTPTANCITIKNYNEFLEDLAIIGRTKKVWFSDKSSYAIYERVSEDMQIMEASPILLMKAVKNPTELAGLKQSCWKDSVSLCELFAWLQEKVDNMTPEQAINGDITYLSELSVEEEAVNVRERWEEFRGLSFKSISAFAAHGAIIHYSSSNGTNVPITKQGTYMLDSGGQYLDGTTDITRTMHYGTPTALEKEAYTRILMGSIDLVRTNFRTGVYGREIDAIAREPLWSNGLDYKHGTGHGIGYFLNIHEGPGRITLGYRAHDEPLEKGMFFSDEPGYYEDGSFGIRLENDMIVVDAVTDHSFSTYEYMTFEMISLVPFDPNLIDFTMLSPAQLEWYNVYTERVRNEIGPALSDRARNWMERNTYPIEYTFTVNSGSTEPLSVLLTYVCLIISARLFKLY